MRERLSKIFHFKTNQPSALQFNNVLYNFGVSTPSFWLRNEQCR